MVEEWRAVVGYEGHYEVSSYGRVKGLSRMLPHNSRVLPEVIRKPWKHPSGYLQIGLRLHGKIKTHKIHRLVAEAFLDNPDSKPTVNHKDRDKSNNALLNLEWATYSENTTHGYDSGMVCHPHKAVIGVDDTGGGLYLRGASEGSFFGLRPSSITDCLRGKQTTHRGLSWEYYK